MAEIYVNAYVDFQKAEKEEFLLNLKRAIEDYEEKTGLTVRKIKIDRGDEITVRTKSEFIYK